MTAPASHPGRGPSKAVVHIGMPKTGTTSIQSWLYRNRQALLRQGILLERINLIAARPNAHIELAVCQFDAAGVLMPNPRVRRFFEFSTLAEQKQVARGISTQIEKIAAESNADVMLFSVEDIGSLTDTEDKARALHGWLGQHFDEVVYILYFRRQEDWIVSAYSQMIKTGGGRPLDLYFEQRKHRDYHAIARRWADAVGRDRLTIRLMEKDAMVEGDLLKDFADAAGFDTDGMTGASRTNEALTRAAGEFVRVLNADLRAEGVRDPVRDPVHDGLIPFLIRTFSDGESYRLDQRQTDEIRAINAESNARLCAEFFPGRDMLFPPRPAASGGGTPPTTEEVARVGAAVLRAKQDGTLPLASRRAPPRPLHRRLARQARRLIVPGQQRAHQQVRN